MTVAVQCPECGAVIPVDIAVSIHQQGAAFTISADPDPTEVWAHAWTHQEDIR